MANCLQKLWWLNVTGTPTVFKFLWGVYLLVTSVQKVYLCPLLPLPVFWDILALWRPGSVVCSPGVAHTSTALCAGDCPVEMSSCHCCFQLVARAKSSLHTFKQEDCVLLPSGQSSGMLPSFLFHWNNSCGMVREVTPAFSVMFPV